MLDLGWELPRRPLLSAFRSGLDFLRKRFHMFFNFILLYSVSLIFKRMRVIFVPQLVFMRLSRSILTAHLFWLELRVSIVYLILFSDGIGKNGSISTYLCGIFYLGFSVGTAISCPFDRVYILTRDSQIPLWNFCDVCRTLFKIVSAFKRVWVDLDIEYIVVLATTLNTNWSPILTRVSGILMIAICPYFFALFLCTFMS